MIVTMKSAIMPLRTIRSRSLFHQSCRSAPQRKRLLLITPHHTIHASRHCRSFQSLADFDSWRARVQETRLRLPENTKALPLLKESAPNLYSVSPMEDSLQLSAPQAVDASSSTVRSSCLQCTYPLATHELLRNSISDFSSWSSFRLGKFYESVDALTADVAYRHAASGTNTGENDKNDPAILVTAGHYHSRKLRPTDIYRDVILRCYVTSVGRSSMEVRTDALQHDTDGKEVLVNVCHTVMVGLDPHTMKSLSSQGKQLPPLVMETADDEERKELANQHQQMRQERSRQVMQLCSPVSSPPSLEEMIELHQLHQQQEALLQEKERRDDQHGKDDNNNAPALLGQLPPLVKNYTFRSATVIFPEQRNVHGKMFGGFVMDEAQKLAQYAATFFGQGQPIFCLGIDEAIFLQAIAIQDMVTFTARVVHSTKYTCRVLVIVEVRDPSERSRAPKRSNRLMFVFGGLSFRSGIIPESYGEILMHMDAQRRYRVEGPVDAEVRMMLEESGMV